MVVFAIVLLLILIGASMLAGCSQTEDANLNAGRLVIRLTDDPADFDEVNIELVAMRVHSEEEGWIDIESFEGGVFNLLELQDGAEVLLADVAFPEGPITQLRLMIGNQNTVVIGGDVLPLTVPSGSQSGVKINLDGQIISGEEMSILLDFDAKKSVRAAGKSNKYNLKPTIKAIMPDGTQFDNEDEG